ncbi:hypothetical protein B0J13DRAFT_1517 [Dactylonectria estremocensis]|uniref:Uncharacterized protein n=1 Tax=Dactylonectria estremocensis TaxID=1079267 RepID=A0A9P9FIH8_9HYPO|nr:hypothetical protein B0J13DRAFT_1517 [Dactylonectria estremocensis]
MDIDLLPNSSGVLPASLSQHKHIPINPRSNDLNRPERSRRYAARAAAKRYAHGSGRYLCKDLGFVCPNRLGSETLCSRCGDPNPVTRRVRVENELRANGILCTVRDRTPRTRSRWIDDKSEGCDLARSAVPLPSDRFRLVRTPSLEREDAFRDAATTKRLRRSPPVTLREDADVAELYRMGLLYDDEQDRGEGFDLNSIEHQEPVYSVRPAKRSRKSKARGWDDLDQLHLNLSFTDLGGDKTIAQFLSPTDQDPPADDQSSSSSSHTSRIFAPLRVIYELDGSQPDVDVDTSQPPDLVSDILSDYDYFSDSDLDDLPSEREVRDSAAAPASDAWVVLGDDS